MDLRLDTYPDGTVDIFPAGVDQPVTATVLSVLIPLGGWWQAPEFGSRLHTLRRSKLTVNMENVVRNYLLQAVKWLVGSGRATDATAAVTRSGLHRIDYVLTVWRGRKPVIFEHFYDVSGGSIG